MAHAIANATGVWIKDLLITPEKILNAIRAKRPAGESLTVSQGSGRVVSTARQSANLPLGFLESTQSLGGFVTGTGFDNGVG